MLAAVVEDLSLPWKLIFPLDGSKPYPGRLMEAYDPDIWKSFESRDPLRPSSSFSLKDCLLALKLLLNCLLDLPRRLPNPVPTEPEISKSRDG